MSIIWVSKRYQFNLQAAGTPGNAVTMRSATVALRSFTPECVFVYDDAAFIGDTPNPMRFDALRALSFFRNPEDVEDCDAEITLDLETGNLIGEVIVIKRGGFIEVKAVLSATGRLLVAIVGTGEE